MTVGWYINPGATRFPVYRPVKKPVDVGWQGLAGPGRRFNYLLGQFPAAFFSALLPALLSAFLTALLPKGSAIFFSLRQSPKHSDSPFYRQNNHAICRSSQWRQRSSKVQVVPTVPLPSSNGESKQPGHQHYSKGRQSQMGRFPPF